MKTFIEKTQQEYNINYREWKLDNIKFINIQKTRRTYSQKIIEPFELSYIVLNSNGVCYNDDGFLCLCPLSADFTTKFSYICLQKMGINKWQ